MDIIKAQALVNEFYGASVIDPSFEALLILLVQAEVLDRPQLNFLKKWVEDATRER